MKLCRLDLIAFGPFDQRSLDFCQGEHGLHVIYGDNEDGKSTSLRAIRALLFGIEQRSRDDHRFKKAQLRVGGRLRLRSGAELDFVRRKGLKDTLRHPESDAPLDERSLQLFLGSLSEQVFSSLYGIDHQELVSGGKAILEETGDVGKALYAAATGTASLKRVLEQTEQEADRLFKPRASTSRIAAAVNEHLFRLKQVREAALSSSGWIQRQQELDEVQKVRAALEDERRGLKQDLSRRARIRRVRPALAQRAELQAALVELGEVVSLPQDFEQLRRDVADSKRSSQERLAQLAAKLAQLAAEEARAQLPTAVLEHAATIELLLRKLGSYEKAGQDLPVQEGKRRQHTNDARELLGAIRPDLEVKNVETMRPLLALKQSIHALVSLHEGLAAEELRAEGGLRQAQDKVALLQDECAQLCADRDPGALTAAVVAAQRAGDLDAQVQAAQESLEVKQEQCRLDLGRLGLWPGSPAELERAPLPGAETIETFANRFEEGARRAQRLADKLQEQGEHRHELEEKIAVLVRGRQVPTADELYASRAHREQGWSLVRRQCFAHQEVEEQVRRYAGLRPLPDVYEEAVRDADEVADQLRADADRVQQRELLEEQLRAIQHKTASLQADAADADRLQDAQQQEWRQLWAPVGITPRSPREMAAWLRQAETLRQQLEELRDCARSCQQLAQRRVGLCQSLGQALAALGEPPGDLTGDLLESLLERALLVLDRVNQGISRRRELGKGEQEARAALSLAAQERESLQGRREQWARAWAETARDLDFLSEPGVARVLATLEQLEALFKAVDRAAELARRVYGIEKELCDFESEVDRFALAIGRPRGELPVDQYVVELNGALTKAREIETQLKGLRQQQEELRGEQVKLGAAIGSIDARLAELRSLARVEGDEALIEAGQRSARARELRSQIAAREQQVLDAGDGHSLAELGAQAEGVDGDDLEQQIAALTERLERVEQSCSEALQRESSLETQLAALNGTAAAAEAAEAAEQALSQLREDVRAYLQLRAATLILKQQIESYRQENQAPVLRRAGELFTRLTLGSFKGLRDELDSSGRPILLGVRPDDQEVTVEGLSDGTRDQLYLALRLATLEKHLAAGEPMPFIVDDILVGFDDQRTEACLQLLAELAARTQVLLFTHHRRVAELAGQLTGRWGAVLHELDC